MATDTILCQKVYVTGTAVLYCTLCTGDLWVHCFAVRGLAVGKQAFCVESTGSERATSGADGAADFAAAPRSSSRHSSAAGSASSRCCCCCCWTDGYVAAHESTRL